MSEPETMHKDIMPEKGLTYKGAFLVDGDASTNAYQYTDPFELRIIPGRQCVMVVEEKGSVNGVTVKYQGRVMTGISGGTMQYSSWVDLPASDTSPEFTIAAGGILAKTCSEGWAEFRIGYKSTVADNHGEVDIHLGAQ